MSNARVMAALEMFLSVALLGAGLWAATFLIPRAIRERDICALACAVAMAVVAVLGWLWIGVRVGAVQAEPQQCRGNGGLTAPR